MFLQYFKCATKGNLIDFEMKKNKQFYIRVLCLLSGTPNTKYPTLTKNYLTCLLLGGDGFSNGGKGLTVVYGMYNFTCSEHT